MYEEGQLVRPKLCEFEDLLGADFVLNTHVTNEFAYDNKLQLVIVRILTSIPRLENFGEKFIRVCMLHGMSERMMTWFRVPLDHRWKQNVMLRVGQIYEETALLRYCQCGGLIHLKRGQFGRFEACTKCTWRQKVVTIEVKDYNPSPTIPEITSKLSSDSEMNTGSSNEDSNERI